MDALSFEDISAVLAECEKTNHKIKSVSKEKTIKHIFLVVEKFLNFFICYEFLPLSSISFAAEYTV